MMILTAFDRERYGSSIFQLIFVHCRKNRFVYLVALFASPYSGFCHARLLHMIDALSRRRFRERGDVRGRILRDPNGEGKAREEEAK
jgi:hypothetical protein